MAKQWDILGVGAATIDDLLFVDAFPAPDSKKQVERVERHGGGLIATALVAVARLGLQAAYAGILGYDDESKWIEADLRREGIDTTPLVQRADAIPIHAYIIVDSQQESRTILFNRGRRVPTSEDLPDETMLRAAHIFMIDDTVTPEIWQVAGMAQALDIPVIADFEREISLAQVPEIDHLIVHTHYAYRATGADNPEVAARLLWHDRRRIVVLTDGSRGCWYYTGGDTVKHHPAFVVEVVDTTGCGDVFHGAYAAALRWGWDVDKRIRFASAAAALNAMHAGGRQGIPNKAEVEAFLQRQDN